jgi:hypothetical protein
MLNNGAVINIYEQKKLDDGNFKIHLSFTQTSKENKIEVSFN